MFVLCGNGTSMYELDYCDLSIRRRKAKRKGCQAQRGEEIKGLFGNMRTRRKEKTIVLKKPERNDMIGPSRVQYSCSYRERGSNFLHQYGNLEQQLVTSIWQPRSPISVMPVLPWSRPGETLQSRAVKSIHASGESTTGYAGAITLTSLHAWHENRHSNILPIFWKHACRNDDKLDYPT